MNRALQGLFFVVGMLGLGGCFSPPVKPSDASLSALAVTVGTLEPSFSPQILNYTVSLPNTVTTLKVTGVSASSQMTIGNPVTLSNLVLGVAQTAVIRVTSPDQKHIKIYKVSVTRTPSHNADLADLTLSTGRLEPAFSPKIFDYQVAVPHSTTHLTLTALKADPYAVVSAPQGVSETLRVGSNPVTFDVRAQDGTLQSYRVTINRFFSLVMIRVPGGTFKNGPGASFKTTVEASYRAKNSLKSSFTMSKLRFSDRFSLAVALPRDVLKEAPGANDLISVSAFRMSQALITREQFMAVMGADPSDAVFSSGLDDPVQRVNWYQAITFCDKLSQKEGLIPVYSMSGINLADLDFDQVPTHDDPSWDAVVANWSANGYRLPTEAEQRWAAMGASKDSRPGDWSDGVNMGGWTKGYSGSTEAGSNQTDLTRWAWFGSNSGGKTHPVATKLPNELGFYDLSGNVWEWNWDWWGPAPAGQVADDHGPVSGTYRVAQGGSWIDYRVLFPIAKRLNFSPAFGGITLGFRVAQTVASD